VVGQAIEQRAGQALRTEHGCRFVERQVADPLGRLVVMFAPLAFVWYLSARVYKMSVASAQLALSSIFLVFTGQSITQVFFVTSAAFTGLSLAGYTTKKDLSGWGSFLFMGVIGVLVASVVNLFAFFSAVIASFAEVELPCSGDFARAMPALVIDFARSRAR